MITDGVSRTWAIVTQRGVILVDVPEPLQRPQRLHAKLEALRNGDKWNDSR